METILILRHPKARGTKRNFEEDFKLQIVTSKKMKRIKEGEVSKGDITFSTTLETGLLNDVYDVDEGNVRHFMKIWRALAGSILVHCLQPPTLLPHPSRIQDLGCRKV